MTPMTTSRQTRKLSMTLLSAALLAALVAPRALAAEGRWPFQPPRDDFSPKALLDLRSLNEKFAGEHGFITRSEDGNDFAFADGTPMRLWAVNDFAFDKDLPRHARFLAKRGINMVRFHCNITPTGSDLMGIDQADRDQLWKGLAAMKQEGIYVTYSPYWAGPARIKPSMGVLDTGGGGNWGLLFFDKKLQAAYKHWMKQVLSEKNPYTGIPAGATTRPWRSFRSRMRIRSCSGRPRASRVRPERSFAGNSARFSPRNTDRWKRPRGPGAAPRPPPTRTVPIASPRARPPCTSSGN